MAYTAADVKNLRERTGAGMMDCKKALDESGGDFEAAVDSLKAKGLAAAAKKSSRTAAEGLVGVAVNGTRGVAVEVNSETDFVAKNDQFQDFVRKTTEVALEAGSDDIEALKNASYPDGGTVGEKLSYSLLTMQAEDGAFAKMGYVMLDGKREPIRDFHTVNCTLGDGLSSIGGWTVAQLENGQTLRIDVEAVDGVVTSTDLNNGGPNSSPAGIEVLSIPRWQGLEGVCDFNMIDNAHRGNQAVSHLFLANTNDGISQRGFDPSWLR